MAIDGDGPVDRIDHGHVPATEAQPGGTEGGEGAVAKKQKAPLTLLTVPVDILRLVVNEITEGSDLIALATVHSSLFELAVAKLYTRFDIYWTPVSPGTDSKAVVDALSYGLATLAHPNKFAQSVRRSRGVQPGKQGIARQLADHDYCRYVRTFYISFGPPEVTSEYSLARESGKLLGTLAAMAVSKMVNLERFIWDMDSGVFPEVFTALSDLQDDEGRSKLQTVWIRLHDKSSLDTPSSSSSSSPTIGMPPPPPPPATTGATAFQNNGKLSTSIGNHVHSGANTAAPTPKGYAELNVVYPTFSILPPLKSLTVLNIDDISYLDEMSLLIGRSVSRLVELRVGISDKIRNEDFVLPWDGPNLQQVDHEASWPGESRIPNLRLGGVLGVLVGRTYDIRKMAKDQNGGKSPSGKNEESNPASTSDTSGQLKETHESAQTDNAGSDEKLDKKLKLQTLELEKVAISPGVALRAIDWSNMTSLTILDCTYHENLWKAMKRQFQPTPPPHGSPKDASPQYRLSLKHFHVEPVTHAFVAFFREAIAPNTVETLFLQDQRNTAKPVVGIEQIFKGMVKRHHTTIKKLLIHIPNKHGYRERWKHWTVKDEFLNYIASGKLRNLTELGIMMNFRDWHSFSRRLPLMAKLRYLYIPQMSRFHIGTRELALQIVDVVSLRREIQLVYIGLMTSCYEIYEGEWEPEGDNAAQLDDDSDSSDSDTSSDSSAGGNNDYIDSDDELIEDSFDKGLPQSGGHESAARRRALPPLRLREITFYDDKVAIFKARNAKL